MPKVLVVEDNELNLDMITRRLARSNWDVLTAVDGRSALQTARESVPDIILMDLNLPDIDGWTATSMLKADPHTARIPVVALTAYAMAGDREKALAAGCDEFETKPVEIVRLLEKMHALTNGRP